MENVCPVAAFIRQRIPQVGKTQFQIAREAGFDHPNIITMIKQGKTRLPLAKVGRMANALETDPVFLMKLCLCTYHHDTWQYVEPMFSSMLTGDEEMMLHNWRKFVGKPSIAVLTDESRALLNRFLLSLRTSPSTH